MQSIKPPSQNMLSMNNEQYTTSVNFCEYTYYQ